MRPGDVQWSEELARLGGGIPSDDAPPSSEAEQERRRAEVDRYLALLALTRDDPDASRSDAVARGVLWSVHPIEDYGIYGAAYDALDAIDPDVRVRALADVLPAWLARHGEHSSMQNVLVRFLVDESLMEQLSHEASTWDAPQRAVVARAARVWARDDEVFERLLLVLGEDGPSSRADEVPEDVPEEWPEDWKAAAAAFRESGRVDLAWRDERDFPSNFDRVFALLELGHGPRWRDVPDLLNPIVVRRRDQVPGFVRALDALPEDRRARILSAVERARPETAEWLARESAAHCERRSDHGTGEES